MPVFPHSRSTRYGFTLLCLAMATLVSWGASHVFGIQAPLLPFSMAVTAAAWFGGLEAGLLATGLGAGILFVLFKGVVFSFLAVQPGGPLIATSCVLGILNSMLVDRAARAYADARATKAELEKANQRLLDTNRSLEQFAASATDSLRTPLRAIGVFAELLGVRHAAQLDNESHEYLRIIVNSVRQMNGVIDGLHHFARATQSQPALLLIDSNTVIRQAIQRLEPEMRAAGAVVRFESLPTVRADEGGLLQVIQNLLANALKYRGDAPLQIEVSAKRQAAEWIFSLADNGIGMQREDLETIFDLFRPVDPSRTGHPGIELAICRATLERFGGRIWAESSPGGGSIFYFALPAGTASLTRTAGA